MANEEQPESASAITFVPISKTSSRSLMANEEQPASATGESASAITKSLGSSYKEPRLSAVAGVQPERVTLGRGKVILSVGRATINENPDSGRKLFVKSTFQSRTKRTRVQSYDRWTKYYMWNEEFVFPLPNETNFIGPVRLRVFQKHTLQKSSSIGEASVHLENPEKGKKCNWDLSPDLVKRTDETEERSGRIEVSICFQPTTKKKRKWRKVSKRCGWCCDLVDSLLSILLLLPIIGNYCCQDDDEEDEPEQTKDKAPEPA